MDGGELTALLTEISILSVVSKIVDAYKKTKEGSRFSERAHFYTISDEMVCALCEAQPKLEVSPVASLTLRTRG